MSKVTLVITTSEQPLPPNVSFANYRYEILAADGVTVVQTGTDVATTFTFPNDVAAGSYTANVVALDASGAVLGIAATAGFTIPVATPTFAQPASVTVTLS